MVISFARRMLTEPDLRLLGKFAYNFGFKGVLSVEKYKSRLKRGASFPPFLFVSVISGCQLRCQGCWVDVADESKHISLEDMNRLIGDAKEHGNSYFGILGGEPFLHPQLMEIFEAHPDCYFQVFTNGQLITDQVAARMRRVSNVSPLISVEGTEIISDERRGRRGALIEHRRVGDLETGQVGHHGLEVQQCFQTALTDFWLVRSVGRI